MGAVTGPDAGKRPFHNEAVNGVNELDAMVVGDYRPLTIHITRAAYCFPGWAETHGKLLCHMQSGLMILIL